MHAKKLTFRIKIKRGGTPPHETYEWEIYRNSGCSTCPSIRAVLSFSGCGISGRKSRTAPTSRCPLKFFFLAGQVRPKIPDATARQETNK